MSGETERRAGAMRKLIFIAAVAALVALPGSVSAEGDEPPFNVVETSLVELRVGDGLGEVHHRPEDPLPYSRSNLTSISVTYKGSWPLQAKDAFEYALGIWEGQLIAKIPISVEANWKALPSGVLGSAAPAASFSAFAGAPTAAYYPAALANQLAGKDLDPKKPEILSNFASGFAKQWYYGTDGKPPTGKIDFVSVVLHEIGHGFGFTGTAVVSGTQGTMGYPTKYIVGSAYDMFIVNDLGRTLLGNYKAKSAEMRSQLQSGKVYWNGNAGLAATPGSAPRLYAPEKWDDGSSIYHLDEVVYPPGDPDSLMTPVQDDGEASQSFGPIIRGILNDIGWTLTPTDPALLYFLENPGGTNPDELLTVQPKVLVLNSLGYTITSDDKTVVTIELVGEGSGVLSCDGGLTRKAKAGLATFSGCRVSGNAINVRIVATAEGVPPKESPPFTILRRGNFRGLTPVIGKD